jgi:hypothetical protein
MTNGDLLAAAERAGFDVLLTADKNMRYQQNLTGRLFRGGHSFQVKLPPALEKGALLRFIAQHYINLE